MFSSIASEFFGHVKGAFTGADKETEGYFGIANGGTLFLDEIGNMPHEMQILLLRVLQERLYAPVGGRTERKTDVRILSATNENLEQAIREGRFREDLYHRLAEFEIRQPSLAECPEDILPLADFFRKRYSEEMKLETYGFTEESKTALLSHAWLGNVRELSNRVKRAVLLSETPLITCQDLGLKTIICNSKVKMDSWSEVDEKERINKILEENSGNVSRTAELLGISRPTLYKKIKKYNLR